MIQRSETSTQMCSQFVNGEQIRLTNREQILVQGGTA